MNSLKKNLIKKYSSLVIKQIEYIRNKAIKKNYLDDAWFLNFLDDINLLSLDPDRR